LILIQENAAFRAQVVLKFVLIAKVSEKFTKEAAAIE
jgi:hypothetical protein